MSNLIEAKELYKLAIHTLRSLEHEPKTLYNYTNDLRNTPFKDRSRNWRIVFNAYISWVHRYDKLPENDYQEYDNPRLESIRQLHTSKRRLSSKLPPTRKIQE